MIFVRPRGRKVGLLQETAKIARWNALEGDGEGSSRSAIRWARSRAMRLAVSQICVRIGDAPWAARIRSAVHRNAAAN